MSVALMRIMMHLLENLEAKAKGYKSDTLAPLFLMNNVHYMVRAPRRRRCSSACRGACRGPAKGPAGAARALRRPQRSGAAPCAAMGGA
jgi:hypothetical protein